MGNEPSTLVNFRLSLHCVQYNEVADRSNILRLVSEHTKAPNLMFTEKAAEIIWQGTVSLILFPPSLEPSPRCVGLSKIRYAHVLAYKLG